MVKGNPGRPRHMVWPGGDPHPGAEPRGKPGLDAPPRRRRRDSFKGHQKEPGFPLGFPLEAASGTARRLADEAVTVPLQMEPD